MAKGEQEPAAWPDASTLNAVDLSILLCLAEDSRRSIRTVAAQVGMSPPSVAERVARMEKRGVITGHSAQIDWSKLGLGLTAYIRVICVQGFEQAAAVAALEALPEVEGVDLVTGDADLLVRVRVHDTEHLRRCIFNGVWKTPGIERTETFICLRPSQTEKFAPKVIGSLLAGASGNSGAQPSGEGVRAEELTSPRLRGGRSKRNSRAAAH